MKKKLSYKELSLILIIFLFFYLINYERILFTGIPFSNSNFLDLDSYKKFIINEAFLGIVIPPNISEIKL